MPGIKFSEAFSGIFMASSAINIELACFHIRSLGLAMRRVSLEFPETNIGFGIKPIFSCSLNILSLFQNKRRKT